MLKDIFIQTIAGLKTIHQHNIVHRDLKPANIFLTDSKEIKLLDFGLVKMLDYTTLTTTGQAIGTPLYIAPEILRGEKIDYRADFYSFGVLVFFLITGGKYPFEAQTPLELYGKVVNNPPTSPTRYNRSISSEFENLVLTLLTKQPYERRFRHDELIRAIRFTPIFITKRISSLTRSRKRVNQMPIPKQCYFRLLHTEKGEIVKFIVKPTKFCNLHPSKIKIV